MSNPDLLIIGGGAAGLSAAATGCELGLSVELLDERASVGGNYYAGAENMMNAGNRLGASYAKGAQLIDKATRSVLRNGTFAWRIEPDGETHFIGESGVGSIIPKRLLIATGAMERPVPIPGALLPGVMYAGAAQLMIKNAGSVPAGRVALVGSGPLLLLLANQLVSLGILPAGIIDTTPRAGLLKTVFGIPAALNSPGLLAEGLGFHRRLKKAGVVWHRHVSQVSIQGAHKAERIAFMDRKGQHLTIDADLVLLHDGIIPNDQVTRLLGCAERWNAEQHCFNVIVDKWGETSRKGIFAAGDCTGIWGVRAAERSGEVAALEIARQLGVIETEQRDRRAKQALHERDRQRAFRPLVERRYPPVLARAESVKSDTVICRCEAVTAGDIRLAISQGATGPNQLKTFTRCGMGPCQGRSCSMAVAEIIAAETGREIGEVGRQDIRSPLKPLPLGRIAAAKAAPEEAPL